MKAVILDIDGTLLLSNNAHAHAFAEAGEKIGIIADVHKIRRLIGKGSDKLIPEAFGIQKESADGKRLDELKGEIFKTYLPSLNPAPGARDLLARLRQDGIKLAVATSASEEDVHQLLDRARVRDLIEDTASSGDADSSKPDPDIVAAALKKAGEKPADTIMIGDTPYDIEAAQRAGVRIIAVRCGGLGDQDLSGAQAIFEHPADILAHYDELRSRFL